MVLSLVFDGVLAPQQVGIGRKTSRREAVSSVLDNLNMWYITMLLLYYMPYWIMYIKSHRPDCVSVYIQLRWFLHVHTKYMYPMSN